MTKHSIEKYKPSAYSYWMNTDLALFYITRFRVLEVLKNIQMPIRTKY